VPPDSVHIPKAPAFRVILHVLQNVFLDVYRVDTAFRADDSGCSRGIVPGARAEVAHFHSLTKSELQNVLLRITKVHTLKIPCAQTLPARNQQNHPYSLEGDHR